MKLLLTSISLALLIGCAEKKEKKERNVLQEVLKSTRARQDVFDSIVALRLADTTLVTRDISITPYGKRGDRVVKKESEIKKPIWIHEEDMNGLHDWKLPVYTEEASLVTYPTWDSVGITLDNGFILKNSALPDTIQMDFLIADTTHWGSYSLGADSLGHFAETEVLDYAYPVGLEKGYVVIQNFKIKEYLTRRKKPLNKNLIVVE